MIDLAKVPRTPPKDYDKPQLLISIVKVARLLGFPGVAAPGVPLMGAGEGSWRIALKTLDFRETAALAIHLHQLLEEKANQMKEETHARSI